MLRAGEAAIEVAAESIDTLGETRGLLSTPGMMIGFTVGILYLALKVIVL